jgi:hypothetical protein
MSFAFHKELIKATSIDNIISGNFIENHPRLINNSNYLLHQILLVRKNRFEVYDLFLDNDQMSKYNYITEYKIFGEIVAVDKTRLSNKATDIIILAIDYAKIVFLEFDENCFDFKILCLYNLENENLSNGKKFYTDTIQLMASVSYSSVFITTNEVNMTFLIKKENQMISDTLLVLNEEEQIKYCDTINGENYFEPSFYINFRDFGVLKIIKFYIPNKENELIDYDGHIQPVNDDVIIIQLLYVEGPGSMNTEVITSNITFMKNKVNLALAYLSKSSHTVVKFDILNEDIDEHSYDMFSLTGSRTIVILSPYVIQYVNFDSRQCVKIVLNTIYIAVLNNHKNIDISLTYPRAKHDISMATSNLDLRGGGYLVLNQSIFLLSDSKGTLFLFALNPNSDKLFSLDPIVLSEANQPVYSLSTPYRFIAMPNPGLFVLASYHSDMIFIQYRSTNEYLISNRLMNLSPIITFNTLQNSSHPSYNNIKFVLTNGYDKNSYMTFVYDKFFAEHKFQKELQEVSYMKSIKLDDDIYSRYLVIGLTKGVTSVFKSQDGVLEEITDLAEINQQQQQQTKLLYCFSFNKNIVLIFDKNVKIFDEGFRSILSVDFEELYKGEIIKQAKHSQNTIILNTYNEKFYKLDLYENDSEEKLTFKFEEFTNNLNDKSGKVLTFTVNSKQINNNKYLLLYRDNNSLEIYDLESLSLIFSNEFIAELPVILSDPSLNDNIKDLELCTSDVSANIVLNNNNIFQINQEQENLRRPEEIFFDILESKIVFSIIFNTGTIAFYEVFFKDNQIRMKKFYVDFIENIDYRDLFNVKLTLK